MAFAGALSALGALNPSASWKDRIRRGAYTPPSGQPRLEFEVDSVSRETEKRTAEFQFQGINDSYISDRGHGSRKYPLSCIFTGPHCDKLATAFESALLETGFGRLEHPYYGDFDVIPFGTISRKDDLVSGLNVSIVDVTFWTGLESPYPASSLDAANEINAALIGFDAAAAQQFDAAADLSSKVAQANLKGTIRRYLAETQAAFNEINQATNGGPLYDAISLSNEALDTLMGEPIMLAQRLIATTKLPARALDSLIERFDVYLGMAERMLGLSTGSTNGGTAAQRQKAQNNVAAQDVMLSGCVAGLVRSVTTFKFSTRPEALEAAETVLALHERVNAWRDAEYAALAENSPGISKGSIDRGASYQALHEAVALTTGYLVDVSFTLFPERRIVLDRPRTILDLCGELYGSGDDKLDFMIQTNSLSATEILEVPRGRTIVYYRA